MPNVVRIKNTPSQVARRSKARSKKTKLDDLRAKKFNQLSNAEKDELLKQVALRLEMIADD